MGLRKAEWSMEFERILEEQKKKKHAKRNFA